jgi:hypothetical protein
MILSSRVARTADVIYFSELHLLVFLVLYRLVYTETSHRDMAAEWAQKYPQSIIYQCQLSSVINSIHLLHVSFFLTFSFLVGMTITCWKPMGCTTENDILNISKTCDDYYHALLLVISFKPFLACNSFELLPIIQWWREIHLIILANEFIVHLHCVSSNLVGQRMLIKIFYEIWNTESS